MVTQLVADGKAMEATIAKEQRISSDSHMAEPFDLWETRLPKAMRENAIRFPGRKLYEFQHMRAGGWDPNERLKDQAVDGISAEVLYPTLGTRAWQVGEPELEEACIRVYNDWLIEFCSVAPQRFWGLAMISLWNIDNAVKELERCKKAGMRGAAIGLFPAEQVPYGSDHYEKFWAAAEHLDMSVNMHINTGPNVGIRLSGRSGLLPEGVHKFDCMRAVGDMIAAGVMERHPKLNVVVAEAGAGWIPFFAQEFDYYTMTFDNNQSGLRKHPSEYIDRQVYSAFISDKVAGYMLSNYGKDTFMWSNDYPHPACIWPRSTQIIAQDLGHLSPEVRAKVVCTTAAKLYNNSELPPPADPPKNDHQDLQPWNDRHSVARVQ